MIRSVAARFVVVAALAATAGTALGQDQPGFFKRMANAAKQGVSDVVQPGQASSEPFYTTRQAGAVAFKGLFDHSERTGYASTLGWPRAAVTFDTFGLEQNCWQGHVVIWTDIHTHTREDFTVCATPTIAVPTATGELAQYDAGKVDALGINMLNQTAPDRSHSGSQRNDGPLPPWHPFQLSLADASTEQRARTAVPNSLGGHVSASSMQDRYIDQLTRLALVSGYLKSSDFASRTAPIVDARMWVVGFVQPTAGQ